MSLFNSLIPGVREVRAPLIAGYLWLLCGWLLLEPHAPSPSDNRIYGRIGEVADAVGPVGHAVAISLVAYLLGSLVQGGFRYVWTRRTEGMGPLRLDEEQQELFDELAEGEDPRGLETILEIANPLQDASIGRPFMKDLSAAVWEIADRELMESFRRLQLAVKAIRKREKEKANTFFGMHARTPVVHLTTAREGILSQAEYVVPHFLPVRDLLGQIHLLETRLLEVAESTGAQVERLGAEADFRLTIAPPLIVLALILTFGVSLLWLLALVIPIALIVQGVDLSQKRSEQAVDALRARVQTPELERITPVFERYRSLTTQLLEGLDAAEWPSGRGA
jgi:hypothetical protein